jgi:hypothetical protein
MDVAGSETTLHEGYVERCRKFNRLLRAPESFLYSTDERDTHDTG